MKSRKLTAGVTLAVVGIAALVLAAWATGGGSRTQAAGGIVGSGKASATKSVCGMGTGHKATGSPIKIGTINMLIPGVDFTTIAKIVNAYFECVNDNGGIHNHPIKYIQYTEQLNPAQESTLAHKLIESDKVVGIVGNTSFAECGTNWKYYEQKHFTVIGAGVQAECYSKPSIVESNMGPRYSDLGAAQALVKRGAKSLIVASPSTLSKYADANVVTYAKEHHIKGEAVPVVLPVTDANSIITHLYQLAGNGGGIILDFTPDTAPALMQAAIAQGIVNKVKWGSSTPIANEFMAKQFPQFDNKIFINQEFSNLTKKGPDSNLWRAVNHKYAPKVALQAFGQMGYMDAKFATIALLRIKGPITAKSYNNSVRTLKNIHTDILCKPWYVGNLPYHIPNNYDVTVTYDKGKVVVKDKCFAIAPVDKSIAQTRKWEKKYKLNTH
ncbi:MAG TPA: ABC transporter substrate-binding protein [Gaiellaceae bacterium]|nr:ABC transporter substrate-binding protein [Gaiellaceae bacterium]